MEMLATDIRHAMATVDLQTMSELLATDAKWGAPDQEVPTCSNALQVLSWYEMARDNGVRANVIETVVIGDNIVVGLNVVSKSDDASISREHHRWQVLSVKGGLVGEIRGYEERREAIDFATSGVSRW
jgi:hypothetical protein